jgi:hypothetical protein
MARPGATHISINAVSELDYQLFNKLGQSGFPNRKMGCNYYRLNTQLFEPERQSRSFRRR